MSYVSQDILNIFQLICAWVYATVHVTFTAVLIFTSSSFKPLQQKQNTTPSTVNNQMSPHIHTTIW